MFYIVSPPDQTDWHIDRDELIELLRRDWPHMTISWPHQSLAARDVIWVLSDSEGDLEGSQDREGKAQYLDGPLTAIARYAAWWRGQVSADQPLILYDESYTTVVPLEAGITPDTVLDRLTKPDT